ncbi:MAG TPA: hypothetical protein VI072_22920 [Polyangiaceae bacterium]
MPRAREVLIALCACAPFVGCGGSQTPAETPNEVAPAQVPAVESAPVPSDGAPSPARPELTAEACEAGGGKVVGDIGDGAIHRPDYRCEGGAAPTGTIRAPAGGPMGVEGSVCCPK